MLKRYVRWSFFSTLSGVLAGLAAAAFLILLDLATGARQSHPEIIWGLPLAGFFVGWVYHRFGNGAEGGSNLILEEIHNPRNVVPARMAPLVLVGTVLTHLFGGSAGREGTAVQMGASLSDQLTTFFKIEPDERKILLVAGSGAGFGAAIGAPWAGVVFGMEVIAVGKLNPFAWFECLVASMVGYYTCGLVGAHHSVYPGFDVPAFDAKTAVFVALAGVAFGLASLAFVKLTHLIETAQRKFLAYPPLRPLVAGIVLVALYRLEGSYRYAGLGIEEIQSSIVAPSSFSLPALKAFFTALTVGSGFKGGEFIPLVFIGATLGSALAVVLPVSFQLLAGVGFAAVFAGASNTPIACTIMAGEIFGLRVVPYAFIACAASYYASGHHGIYKSQKIHGRKGTRTRGVLRWLVQWPKRIF